MFQYLIFTIKAFLIDFQIMYDILNPFFKYLVYFIIVVCIIKGFPDPEIKLDFWVLFLKDGLKFSSHPS